MMKRLSAGRMHDQIHALEAATGLDFDGDGVLGSPGRPDEEPKLPSPKDKLPSPVATSSTSEKALPPLPLSSELEPAAAPAASSQPSPARSPTEIQKTKTSPKVREAVHI
jgi:hypothetical protein